MRHRGAVEIDVLEEAVDRRRRHALAPLLPDFRDLREQPVDVLAFFRRDEDHGRVVQEFQFVADLFFESLAVGRCVRVRSSAGTRALGALEGRVAAAASAILVPNLFLADQVPLVDDDDQRPPAFVSVSGNGGVAGGNAFGRVHHQQRDVGSFRVLARHHDRELFGHQLGLALAADARGIDEAIGLAVAFDHFIHRVARGARDGGYDGAIGRSERVQQRGLPYVRPPDDGDLELPNSPLGLGRFLFELIRGQFLSADFCVLGIEFFLASLCVLCGDRFLFRFGLALRHHLHHRIQQLRDAVGVFRRNRVQALDAQGAEVLRRRFHLLRVDLVHRQEHRFAGANQQARQFQVRRRQFRASIHHHGDCVGFIERHARLAKDFRRDQLFVVGDDTAGIDHAEAAARPLGDAI